MNRRRTYIGDLIQSDLGLVDGHVEKLAKKANRLYYKMKVKGRTVFSPALELKLVQCWISDFLHCVSDDLPDYVSAYEPGCSIKHNALLHASSAHILNVDISRFFPSCKRTLVEKVFSEVLVSFPGSPKPQKLSEKDIALLADLACYKDALCIGAPSSPAIANRILLDFDKSIKNRLGFAFTYSRYSDDITISSKEWIDRDLVVDLVSEELREFGFVLNEKKTHCVGRGNKRRITGVFLKPDGTLSIGKKLKSTIKRELYTFLVHNNGDVSRILGLINFARYIDPEWTSALLAKYNTYGLARGKGVIKALNEARI